jgi:L-lactate dehydrogenase complex protein LldE
MTDNNQPSVSKPIKKYPDKPKKVYFFGTCLIDLLFPEAGLHGIQLLEREGIQVCFPEAQSCCGQPAYNSGYDKETRKVAAVQIGCLAEDIPVVVPSASCASMIIDQYPPLFAGTPLAESANKLAARTFELTDFLLNVCKIQLKDKGEPVKVAYHNSCSAQRHLKVDHCSSELLQQLSNVALLKQERAHECCGFGGTFSVKSPAISNAMVQDKCDSLLNTHADLLLSGDCSCMMNITGAMEKREQQGGSKSMPAKHIATFLLERT